MTSSLKHTCKKTNLRQRDRAQRSPESQLTLFTSQPAHGDIPTHPLVAKVHKSSRSFWGCDRYYLYCAYTGEQRGFPFFPREVEYLLSHFSGWRSPITHDDFQPVAEWVVKNGIAYRAPAKGVAA